MVHLVLVKVTVKATCPVQCLLWVAKWDSVNARQATGQHMMATVYQV